MHGRLAQCQSTLTGNHPAIHHDGRASHKRGFGAGKEGNNLNPLTSPKGTQYNTATAKDMEEAVAAGEIKIAPLFAPEGNKPGCHVDVFGFVIPKGAKNRAGAEAYINWVMDPANNVEWVTSAGGGIPAQKKIQADTTFQTEIYKQGAAAASASACKPWYGSLLKIPEAKKIITTTIFDLIKTNPEADIAAALTAAQDEYNNLP